jgi:hypothetical protein
VSTYNLPPSTVQYCSASSNSQFYLQSTAINGSVLFSLLKSLTRSLTSYHHRQSVLFSALKSLTRFTYKLPSSRVSTIQHPQSRNIHLQATTIDSSVLFSILKSLTRFTYALPPSTVSTIRHPQISQGSHTNYHHRQLVLFSIPKPTGSTYNLPPSTGQYCSASSNLTRFTYALPSSTVSTVQHPQISPKVHLHPTAIVSQYYSASSSSQGPLTTYHHRQSVLFSILKSLTRSTCILPPSTVSTVQHPQTRRVHLRPTTSESQYYSASYLAGSTYILPPSRVSTVQHPQI